MEGKKEKKETCVELNIFVECNNCKKRGWEEEGKEDSCKKEKEKKEEETCVEINVFVDCDKK